MIRKWFYAFVFKALGWKIEGNRPQLDKYLIVVAPHTSTKDFWVGLAVKRIFKLKEVHFIAKKSLFKFPVGLFLRSLGGYPVDRSQRKNLVDQIVEMYSKHPKFALAVTPEGTRSKVNELKTGFYHIAKKANVPIIKVAFDFSLKKVFFDEPFYLSNDQDADIQQIINYYKDKNGYYPEQGIKHLAKD